MMQYGEIKSPSFLYSYSLNNTPKNLLISMDKMFGGYDVYSRFQSSNFFKNKDGNWLHQQIIRDLNYKAEVLERDCILKDGNWWKDIAKNVTGLKQ